ncbi:hypothetical protein EXN66_Car008087 [Channa argus]|uniref:Uncharacterized protein n=1 Tax=Channa argus TaxID=215402 RepID=A0A6G1PPY8_CHAAH|nr:hypothetical protein EXN66_Car008087 [Channa argus]
MSFLPQPPPRFIRAWDRPHLASWVFILRPSASQADALPTDPPVRKWLNSRDIVVKPNLSKSIYIYLFVH